VSESFIHRQVKYKHISKNGEDKDKCFAQCEIRTECLKKLLTIIFGIEGIIGTT
jgi:hypothetical protein